MLSWELYHRLMALPSLNSVTPRSWQRFMGPEKPRALDLSMIVPPSKSASMLLPLVVLVVNGGDRCDRINDWER